MTNSRSHYHHLLTPAKELEPKRNGHGMNAFKNGYTGAESLHSTSASGRMVLPGQDLTTHLAATPQYPAQSLTLLDFPMSHIPSDIRPMYPPYGMGRPGSYTSMLDPSMSVLPSQPYGYRSPMKDNQVKYNSSYQQSAYANVSTQNMSSNIHGKYQTPLQRPINTPDKLSKETLPSANPSKGYSHKDMAAYYQGTSSSKHGQSTYSNLQPVDYRDKSKYEQDPYSSSSHKSSLYSNGKYRNPASTASNAKSSINQSIMPGERSRNGSPYLPPYASYNNYQPFQSQPYSSNYLDKQYAAISLSPFYNNSNGIPKPVYSSDMLATSTNHPYYSQSLHKQSPYPYPSNHLPSSQSVPSMHKAEKYLSDASKMMTPSVSDSPTMKQRPLKQKFIEKAEMKEKHPIPRPTFAESKQRPYSSTPKDLDKMPDMKKVNEKPPMTHKATFSKPLEYPLPNVTTTRSSVIQQNVITTSSLHPITVAGCISTVVCTSVTTTANHGFEKSESKIITTVVQSNVTPTTTASVIDKPVEAQQADEPVLPKDVSEKPATPTSNAPTSTSKAAAPSKRRSSLRDETDFLYDVWMSSSEGEAENDDSSDEDYRCPEGSNARKQNLRSNDKRGGSKRPQRRSSRRAIEIINSSSDTFLPFTIPDIDKNDAEKAVSACQSPQKSEKDLRQHEELIQAETMKTPVVSKDVSTDFPFETVTPVDGSAVKKKRGRPGRPKTSPEDGEERVKRKYVRKKPLVPRNKATAEKRNPDNEGETKVKRRRLSKGEKKEQSTPKQDQVDEHASKDGISEPMDPLSSLGLHVENLLASAESITQQVTSVMKKKDDNVASTNLHLESDGLSRFQNRTEKNMKNLKSLKEAKQKIQEKKSEKAHKPRGRPRVRPGDGLKRYGSRKKKRPRNIANIVASSPTQEAEKSPEYSKKIVPELDSTPDTTKEKPTKRNLSFELPPTPEEFSCSDEAMSPVAEPLPESTFAKLNVKKLTCNSAIGETVLHKAAKLGSIEHLMYYLDQGHYDVNVAENAGYTPLHKAAAYNQREAALFLLSRGADVTKCSIDGTLPLHDAVINDHLEMTRILLAAGADPLVSKFSGTNILSMFYSDNMKQYINAHLKDINSSKADPQQTQDKWRMPCSAVFDDKSEHVYNCVHYPPKPENHHIEFEFFEDEPIQTFYMQLKDDEERAEYCLVGDLISFSGNHDFEYDHNLNSKFVSFKRFKQQVNDSQIQKKTVHCQEICEKYKIGGVPCPLKVVKFDHKIRKLLKIETSNVSACRDNKSRSKEHNQGANHDVSEQPKPCEKQPVDGDEESEISVPKSCNSCTDNYLKGDNDKLNTNFPVSDSFQETTTTSVNNNIITPSKDGDIEKDSKEVEKHTLS